MVTARVAMLVVTVVATEEDMGVVALQGMAQAVGTVEWVDHVLEEHQMAQISLQM